MNIPDNYDIWNAHDIEKERMRARLPVCDNRKCRRHIDGDYFWEIEGDILCEKCMNERYRRSVEDYIQID